MATRRDKVSIKVLKQRGGEYLPGGLGTRAGDAVIAGKTCSKKTDMFLRAQMVLWPQA